VNDDEGLEKEADEFSYSSIVEGRDESKIKLYGGKESRDVTQLMRKLVRKKNTDLTDSLWFDKRDKKYYKFKDLGPKFFNEVEESSKIEEQEVVDEAIQIEKKKKICCEELLSDEPGTISEEEKRVNVTAKEKDILGLNSYALECKNTKYVQANLEDPHYMNFDVEESVRAERYYAEGDMSHVLAISEGYTKKGDSRIIKGSEYRRLEGSGDTVKGAYGDTVVGNIRQKSQTRTNLEISFGGNTGDMTKHRDETDEEPRRLYDLLQATFFWIPKTDIREGLMRNLPEDIKQINQKIEKDENENIYNRNNLYNLHQQEDNCELVIRQLSINIEDLQKTVNFLYAKGRGIEGKEKNAEKNILINNRKDQYVRLNRIRKDILTLSRNIKNICDRIFKMKKDVLGIFEKLLFETEVRVNKDYLIDFLKSSSRKVKDTGDIKIVLMNKEPYVSVAKDVIAYANANDIGVSYLRKEEKRPSYAKFLTDLKLNSSNSFVHRRTISGDELKAPGGDVIYIFKKKRRVSR